MLRSIVVPVLVRLFPVLVAMLVFLAVYPAFFDLAPFLLCGFDGADVHVVRQVTNPEPGETSVSFDYYCFGEDGGLSVVRWYRILPGYLLVAVVVAALWQLADAVRGKVTQDR